MGGLKFIYSEKDAKSKNILLLCFEVHKISRGECSYYVHIVSNSVGQSFSHAEEKRKQKIKELINSPVKNYNMHQANGKRQNSLVLNFRN